MIFDRIDQRIGEMKNLRRLELFKANCVQQEATDAQYRTLVEQVESFVKAIAYVRDNLQFAVSDTLQSDLEILLESLKDVTKTGYAEKEAVEKVETDFKAIRTIVRKDWGKHFSALTFTMMNTLRVISGIESEKVRSCITDIKTAESWSVDVEIFVNLKRAMEDAASLIQSLNMDQEIILFLTKMTSGKATIADLNEKVLNWIKNENLEKKIKLSFLFR